MILVSVDLNRDEVHAILDVTRDALAILGTVEGVAEMLGIGPMPPEVLEIYRGLNAKMAVAHELVCVNEDAPIPFTVTEKGDRS